LFGTRDPATAHCSALATLPPAAPQAPTAPPTRAGSTALALSVALAWAWAQGLTGTPSCTKTGRAPTLVPSFFRTCFSNFCDETAKVRYARAVSKKELLVDRVKPYLDRLNAREISLRQVAAELSTSETYLCEITKPLLRRIQSSTEYRRNRANLKESRSKYREFLAKRVKLGEITVETAAICANCSIRTIYRYVGKLPAREGEKV
jgi:hypothetical protein